MKYLIDPESNGCLKKLKLIKVMLKKLKFFYSSHIDGIICVKQIGLGLIGTLKKYLNRIKISSDINFIVTSWFLGNVRVKPYSNTQCLGNQCKQKAGVVFVFSLPFERLFWTNFQFTGLSIQLHFMEICNVCWIKKKFFIIHNKKGQVLRLSRSWLIKRLAMPLH